MDKHTLARTRKEVERRIKHQRRAEEALAHAGGGAAPAAAPGAEKKKKQTEKEKRREKEQQRLNAALARQAEGKLTEKQAERLDRLAEDKDRRFKEMAAGKRFVGYNRADIKVEEHQSGMVRPNCQVFQVDARLREMYRGQHGQELPLGLWVCTWSEGQNTRLAGPFQDFRVAINTAAKQFEIKRWYMR